MRRLVIMRIVVAVLGLLAPFGTQWTTPAMALTRDLAASYWMPVSEAVLDGLRGGFQSSQNGPILSFGIERQVFMNGHLVSSVAFTIPDATRIAAHVSETISLVQRGGGNEMPHNVGALPPLTTVVQNSLDHQTIQSQTVINATVQALTWARSLDLGHALAQANLDALRH